MGWLDRILTKIEDVLMISAFLGAFVLGVSQVVMRYVFKTGIIWTEQFVVVLTILAAMMGGSRAVAAGVHVRITLAIDKMPPSRKRYFDVFGNLVSIAYCLMMAYAGLLYVNFLKMTGAVSPESDMPLWVIFMIMPIAMIMFSLRYFLDLPLAWTGERKDAVDLID